jgi:hypothetical protein
MSARKAAGHVSDNHVTVEGKQTRLTLSPDAIIISRNGMEFRSANPYSPWKEMTLTLQSTEGRVHCNGVVISCTGSRHSGYHVSVVFTGMTRQAEARLAAMAGSRLA